VAQDFSRTYQLRLRIGCQIAFGTKRTKGFEEKRRKQMKASAKDQIEGRLHEVIGTVKEKAGQVTKNPDLAAEGQDEKLAGVIQGKVGQIEKVFEK
jgi:uncharacterized protein YjbJ (UPF0337 family)